MRWTLALTLGLSMTAHVGLAAALFWPRAPRAPGHAAEPSADPAPRLAGETFELPAPETAEAPLANASPSPETAAAPVNAEASDAPAHPAQASRSKPARAAERASREGRPSGGRVEGAPEGAPGGTAATTGLYGAVGDRSAQELTTAFLRAFMQTASADKAWQTTPLGAAGDAIVTITLDESGRISDFAVGGSPSPTLARGIRSTMVLVKPRPFVAKGKVTKLHMIAAVKEDTTNVFGIRVDDDTTSFTLPIGRRIDLRVVK